MIQLKLAAFQNHIGHCQITYYCRNKKGERLVYCLQENFDQLRLMRCTQECEPMYEVNFDNVVDEVEFERPYPLANDTEYAVELKTACCKWIDEFEKKRKKACLSQSS